MLRALYEYALRHNLTMPEGCVKKTVKAWVHLDAEGGFRFVEPVDNESVIAPDIGSLANGKDKSNVLVEKRSVVFPEEPGAKSVFFRRALLDGGGTEPALGVCAKALENPETVQAICAALDACKVKASERVCFKVGDLSILESPETLTWWRQWRRQFLPAQDKGTSVCLITGAPAVPVTTTTPINGLQVVGGHARGDALICFDKNAFCSYGLKKAANAPVSEEAFAAVKAALDALLERAPILAGMKLVHWYDAEMTDIIEQSLGLGSMDEDEEEEELTEEERQHELEKQERSRNRQADLTVEQVRQGGAEDYTGNAHYYILMLTGVGGRVMIRRYERGNYADLRRNLAQWEQDLKLTNSSGTGNVKPCKLTARLIRLLKYQKSDSRPFERLAKELSGVTPAVLTAILSGGPLPATVAARALASIRSEMQGAEEDERSRTTAYAYQWLKVWLLRENRKNGSKEELMEGYNWEHSEAAYHFGGMMAVFGAIQVRAKQNKDKQSKDKQSRDTQGSNVVQRYFASAMQTPALVLGQLSRRSVHHLEKMENEWLAKTFMSHLQRLSLAAGDTIPQTLTLRQQSYFALGYYQMGAEMERQKREQMAKKKENKED